MSTIQTVKTQIQSLINLANTTTGNTDTNLTDGVNALVSGFGQGGSGGDTIENGVTVCVYDEDNNLIQKYDMESGFIINEPFYISRGWVDDNGVTIQFPLLVTESINIYANGKTYAKTLYDHFGISQIEYPFLQVEYASDYLNQTFVAFGKTIPTMYGKQVLYEGYMIAISNNIYDENLATYVSNIVNSTSASNLKSYSGLITYCCSESARTYYLNFEASDYVENPVGTFVSLNQ